MPQTDLLYPFYLDIDMTLAFSAALAGGVVLQSEEIAEKAQAEGKERELSAGIHLFDILSAGARGSKSKVEAAKSQSRMMRQHTEASIFITLYDELIRRYYIQEADISALKPGELTSLRVGPATAPLLRVVDQILRLFDLTNSETSPASPKQPPKQEQVSGRGTPSKKSAAAPQASTSLGELKGMFNSLKADLEFSGMTDVVVRRESDFSVVLTLDNRFVTEQALELLHTSEFNVIGKVTQIWRTESEFVNLYRRSVLSLVPALTGAVGFLVMGLLFGIAKNIDVAAVQASVGEIMGVEPMALANNEPRIGEDVNSVLPIVQGPALQILPLAICT